jgi:hypothetical protein
MRKCESLSGGGATDKGIDLRFLHHCAATIKEGRASLVRFVRSGDANLGTAGDDVPTATNHSSCAPKERSGTD